MYSVELIKDLKKLPIAEAKKVIDKIRNLEKGLVGDIKKLTNHTPEYRLRIGDYRVLFEIEEQNILIYRIKHRKEAYL